MPIHAKQTIAWAVFLATVMTIRSAEVVQEPNPNNMGDEKQWSNIQMPKVSYFEGNPSLMSEIRTPLEPFLEHQLPPKNYFVHSIKYHEKILPTTTMPAYQFEISICSEVNEFETSLYCS